MKQLSVPNVRLDQYRTTLLHAPAPGASIPISLVWRPRTSRSPREARAKGSADGRQRQQQAAAGEGVGTGEKLRILCLHGSRQSAAILQKRLKTLVRKSAAIAELVFIDAPHVRPVLAGEEARSETGGHAPQELEDRERGGGAEREGPGEENSFCWWLPGLAKGEVHVEWAAQWDTSREALTRVLEDAAAEGRPFDGVLGFSNGAAAAALLLAAPPAACPPLRFALLAGGYLPHSLADTHRLLDIPSLHMHGAADTLIAPQQAQQLQSLFEDPQVLGLCLFSPEKSFSR